MIPHLLGTRPIQDTLVPCPHPLRFLYQLCAPLPSSSFVQGLPLGTGRPLFPRRPCVTVDDSHTTAGHLAHGHRLTAMSIQKSSYFVLSRNKLGDVIMLLRSPRNQADDGISHQTASFLASSPPVLPCFPFSLTGFFREHFFA